jgi:hypothetical protein
MKLVIHNMVLNVLGRAGTASSNSRTPLIMNSTTTASCEPIHAIVLPGTLIFVGMLRPWGALQRRNRGQREGSAGAEVTQYGF